MPQASSEDQDRMIKWFGGIDDAPIIAFLKSRGYRLTHHWFWIKPVPCHTVTREEYRCLQFLIDEWDFGGIEHDGGC